METTLGHSCTFGRAHFHPHRCGTARAGRIALGVVDPTVVATPVTPQMCTGDSFGRFYRAAMPTGLKAGEVSSMLLPPHLCTRRHRPNKCVVRNLGRAGFHRQRVRCSSGVTCD